MLHNTREIFDIVCKSSLNRYDLSQEWSQFKKKIKYYKTTLGRGPFIYELIPHLFFKINDSIKKEVQTILFQKECDWFFKIGQYFLYNTFQWTKNFNYEINNTSENNHLIQFLEKWWNKFLDFENNEENHNKMIPFPKKILLELTNNCNLNCIMCGVGKKGYDPTRDLPIDLLYSLSENVLTNADLIRLNGLGESTIMKNFLEYLNILSTLSAQLEIVTNLTSTNYKIWDALLESNTNFLISCDSSHSQLFESIRRGASFKIFKKNLQYISSNISNPLQGQIIFTLVELNIHEIAKVVKFAAEMGLGGIIINVVRLNSDQNDWMYQQFEKIVEQFQKAYQIAEDYNILLKLPDHIGKLPINKNISNPSCQSHCKNPWEEVYIRYNGDLTVCNMLNPYIYGNCRNSSFEEIWNGLNAELFRAFVNTKYRHYYCEDCYYLV